MTKCEHGFAKPEQCTDCMYEGNVAPPPRPPKPVVEARFAAQYEGQCPSCNLPINMGEPIARLSNSTYVHQGNCEP